MLAEFGDAGNEAVVGSLVEEDGVVGFFFGFAFGPFLHAGFGSGGGFCDSVFALFLALDWLLAHVDIK